MKNKRVQNVHKIKLHKTAKQNHIFILILWCKTKQKKHKVGVILLGGHENMQYSLTIYLTIIIFNLLLNFSMLKSIGKNLTSKFYLNYFFFIFLFVLNAFKYIINNVFERLFFFFLLNYAPLLSSIWGDCWIVVDRYFLNDCTLKFVSIWIDSRRFCYTIWKPMWLVTYLIYVEM